MWCFRLAINEAGQVDYRVVINALNWRHHPVAGPSSVTMVTRAPVSGHTWQGNESSGQLVQVVRCDALMQDLST